MRVVSALIAGIAARGLRRELFRDVDVDVDFDVDNDFEFQEAGAQAMWVPISPKGEATFYYNPRLGRSVAHLPKGTRPSTLLVHQDPEPAEGDAGKEEKPKEEAKEPEGEAKEGEAKEGEKEETTTTPLPTIVPEAKRKSCMPHCAWNCTEPVCEQNCEPLCGVPKCETRCPKMGSDNFKGCKVNCGDPSCAMFCPKDPCMGNKTLDCNTPKCSTKCDKPKCQLDCHEDGSLGCKTICPEPQCQWRCRKPKDCPAPECKMVCEQPPDCAISGKLMIPPPLPDGWESSGKRTKAKVQEARWIVGEWGLCSTRCGTGRRTRRVFCNSHSDEDCNHLGKKPKVKEYCEESVGCQWNIGEWGHCSAKCGPGTKERHVSCDGPKCPGDQPVKHTECSGEHPDCEKCKVTIWGGKGFKGWEVSLPPGSYGSAELEYRGVKCDDISSVQVQGVFCETVTFEYGDFNQAHSGWQATFREGKYDVDGLEAGGAKDNDISSLKVRYWGDRAYKNETPDNPRLAGNLKKGRVPEVPPVKPPSKEDIMIMIGIAIIVGLLVLLLIVVLWPSSAAPHH
mmetsp:Transcript_2981/g.7074  ORF Transcript_2981/g.7074 Transcript_2981/m.7074 type:complete len:565 (+) Transcript_2981:155-1849(+)